MKLYFYKLWNFKRIQFPLFPKINHSVKLGIQKKSKLILGKQIRVRNNVSFRVYGKGKVNIGTGGFFNDGCSVNCRDEIVIGKNIKCGQNVMFFDHDHDYRNNIEEFVTRPIYVGDDVWIGANCIILKGVTIGDRVVIAAGTIIKNDIESDTVVYQNRDTIVKRKS